MELNKLSDDDGAGSSGRKKLPMRFIFFRYRKELVAIATYEKRTRGRSVEAMRFYKALRSTKTPPRTNTKSSPTQISLAQISSFETTILNTDVPGLNNNKIAHLRNY